MNEQQARERFGWLGEYVQLHEIGEYAIAEYIAGSRPRFAFATSSTTSNSYTSLEAAIINAIAIRYDGLNSQGGSLLCRALGIIDKE